MRKRYTFNSKMLLLYTAMFAAAFLLFAGGALIEQGGETVWEGIAGFGILLASILLLFGRFSYVLLEGDHIKVVTAFFWSTTVEIQSIERIKEKNVYGGLMKNTSIIFKDSAGKSMSVDLVSSILGEKSVAEIVDTVKKVNLDIKLDASTSKLLERK